MDYITLLKEKYNYNYTFGNAEKQYNIFQSTFGIPDHNTVLLWEASKKGELALVIEAFSNIKSSNIKEIAFERAVKWGHLDIVKYLVENGIDIHTQNDQALKYACIHGRLEVVKYLIENGADISKVYENNMAVLIEVANNGYLNVIKYLLEIINSTEYSEMILLTACVKGHLNMVKYLVEKGTNIHFLNEQSLWSACQQGHLDIVKYLIEKGAVINDDMLECASSKGNLKIVKYLVERGADVHANDEQTLKSAYAKGYMQTARYLVEQGADISKVGSDLLNYL